MKNFTCPFCGKEISISLVTSVMGKAGSKTLLERRGTAYMKEISKKGLDARWHKNEK
jgi:transcription elongation factor Elf1